VSIASTGLRPKAKLTRPHLSDWLLPVANVINLFSVVIYYYSVAIPSFSAIKHYYCGDYHGMAVNYNVL
jgi:hypothetical protein